jgi:hypothetical protein
MNESLDAALLGTLKHDMCAIDVGIGKSVRITKAQVNMGLSGEVEDCINIVVLHALHHIGRLGDVSKEEREIVLALQSPSIVEGRAVVQFVEGYNIVGVGVRQGKVSNQPTGSFSVSVTKRDN